MNRIAVGALLLCLSVPASAQEMRLPCVDYAKLPPTLKETHGEVKVWNGLDHDGDIVEIFVSPQGTFSIIVHTQDERACLLSAGEGWRAVPRRGKGL